MKKSRIPNPTLNILGKKIIFSTLIQYFGKAFQVVLSAIILKYIANFLNQSEHGVYGLITEYILFFSVAANLGIFANVIRKMADAPKDGNIFLNSLFLRVITAGIFFGFAIFYLWVSGADNVFIIGSIFFGLALLLDYVTSVCDAMLQASYMMGRATFALMIGRIFYFLGVFLLVKGFLNIPESFELPFILLTVFVGSLVTAILSLYFVFREIDFHFKIDKKYLFEILKISLPFGIINLINNLYFRFLPDWFANEALSKGEFAIFNSSFRIAQVLSMASTFLMFSVLPGFKQYLDQKHWAKARKILRRVVQIIVIFGVCLVIFGSFLGPWMLELVTKKQYVVPEFSYVLPMMLVLAAISYGYDLVLISLFALGKEVWFLKREVVAVLLSLLAFFPSLVVDDVQMKLFLIILGAIVGEGFMVVVGGFKLREFMRKVI